MQKDVFKRSISIVLGIAVILCSLVGIHKGAIAKIDWEVLKEIALDEAPNDIAISSDGTTIYILSDKNILIYSMQDDKVTDTIPITGKFSQIELFEESESLFLTDRESKQVSIIQITPVYTIEVDKSPVIGKSDAPVSVVAFLDFQCPYCSRVFPVLEELLEKYPNDVNLIIKHFPLRMHPFAEKASMAALAASKQDKYRDLTRIFLSNYKDLNDDTINKYAKQTGLDMNTFEADYMNPFLKKMIEKDVDLGRELKVRGVPALFLNGRPVKNRSLDNLSNMVERELKKKK